MASGVEWMFNAILHHLDLDPEQVKKQIVETAQIVVALDSRLARIEAKQDAILAYLRPPDTAAQRMISNGTDTEAGQHHSEP